MTQPKEPSASRPFLFEEIKNQASEGDDVSSALMENTAANHRLGGGLEFIDTLLDAEYLFGDDDFRPF